MKKIFTLILTILFISEYNFVLADELLVEYTQPEKRNYGTVIQLRFYRVNKKGKKKDLTKYQLDEMSFTATNCRFNFYLMPGKNDLMGKLVLAPTPQQPLDSICKIDFIYTDKKETLTKSLEFKLNYKGEISLDFSGVDGKGAKTYDGFGQFVFSNKSKDGQDGEAGTDGLDVEITIMKKYTDTDSSYSMVLHDLKNDLYYSYYLPNSIEKISVLSFGGNGGEGSDGTDGSQSNRFRVDGGNAGNGGNGGNAGRILFYLDERAKELESKINLLNTPGLGGFPGSPGKGVTHKDHPEYVGVMGRIGNKGNDGKIAEQAKVEYRKFE